MLRHFRKDTTTLFIIFSAFLDEKVEKADFEQGLMCATPKRWLKYKTP